MKRENYYGLLTCNPETFQKANVAIFPLDKFIFNYQFERIYSHKEPIIINYSVNSISKIWYKKAYKYDISSQKRGIIDSLPDLIKYINVANIDSEYFFRVTREIDRELILDIVKLIRWNRFGKTVIFSASNIEIAVHFWNKNAEGNYHLHNNCICASYVLSGELTEEHYETGKIIKHSQDKWNFVNLGTNHKLSNRSPVCLTLVVFKVFKQDNNLFKSVKDTCNA